MESVKELEATLRKEEKHRGRTEAKGRPPLAMELEHGMHEKSLRGGQMRGEVEAFVAAYSGPGLAPADGRAFAERLVGALLHGQPGSSGDALDMAAAAEVYGAFADAFLRHDWKEPRLRVGRRVVIRAAAAE